MINIQLVLSIGNFNNGVMDIIHTHYLDFREKPSDILRNCALGLSTHSICNWAKLELMILDMKHTLSFFKKIKLKNKGYKWIVV